MHDAAPLEALQQRVKQIQDQLARLDNLLLQVCASFMNYTDRRVDTAR